MAFYDRNLIAGTFTNLIQLVIFREDSRLSIAELRRKRGRNSRNSQLDVLSEVMMSMESPQPASIQISSDKDLIFKICPASVWHSIRQSGHWEGSAHDLRDGYVHLSARHQVQGTLEKHFSGQHGLLLLAVDPVPLAPHLRWELSRGGELFPHLYGPLPISAVVRIEEIRPSGETAETA